MKERVVVFGDGIIAIILTIMVLELPIKYGLNGVVDISALFRAVGIYFISFCFVANLWFQTAYAFNRVDTVKNKNLVFYLVLLFFLSLVPSATRMLIEDTIQQTILIYGILTLIVTVIMQRLIISLNKQSNADEKLKLQRVHELNRQGLFTIVLRVLLLIFAYFFIHAGLIIYLILPIMTFLQNIIDREEDTLVDELDYEQQADYYQDRNRVWGGTMQRYSQLLRDSMRDANKGTPDRREQIMTEWNKRVDQEISSRMEQLNTATKPERNKLEHELKQLQRQKERLEKQKQSFENRRIRKDSRHQTLGE